MNRESVNAAPDIAALFADGAVAYATRDEIAADVLLPEERACLDRAVPKRIAEFAAGRLCARTALAQLGCGGIAVPMRADRAPQWPPGSTGSITHTDGFCAAVVAQVAKIRALGLDVEPVASVRPHLWRRICTPPELEALQALDAKSAIEAATLIFSAKEAFYKCQHALSGEWLGFCDVRISIGPGGFTVHPCRPLLLSAQVPGPWHGRYRREAQLVLTGVCII
jgi:4'-phosphopantetheinyl transferase EntD